MGSLCSILGVGKELWVQLDPDLPDLPAKVDVVTQMERCRAFNLPSRIALRLPSPAMN